LLVLFYYRIQGRRKKLAEQYGSMGFVPNDGSTRRHIPALIFLAGITILVFSLARPQATISLPKLEGTVILTFDVSGSMAADDAEPTRMEAAKAAAIEFVKRQPSGVLIGVVAFSDGGISVQTPTDKREGTIATIERLVPRRGTSVGNGVLVALNTIAVDAGDPPIINTSQLSTSEEPLPAPQGWYPSSVIVLFSDGENNENPDPAVVSDLAVDLGVRIYTVGVGTALGTTINVDGMTVQSQLDEAMLQYIADTTGGGYYNAGEEDQLDRIYRDLQPELSIKPEELELTSIFAGFGIIIFLIGGMLSMRWFGHVP
jgi:Ca-activated chloride channel family protein